MVQHSGDRTVVKQGDVVFVEVIGDEGCRPSAHLAKGVEDGVVAAADRVDGSDVWVTVEGAGHGSEHRHHGTVGLGDISDGSVGGQGPHGGPEPHFALFLTAKTAAA